jgi:hypothetical protein
LALTGFYFIISWISNTGKIEEVAVTKIFFYISDGRILEFTTESLALQGGEEVRGSCQRTRIEQCCLCPRDKAMEQEPLSL